MWLFIKLAWRNIFRNTRRTVIASIAIGIGFACLLFFDSFIIGLEYNMIRSATSSFLGQAQIHRRGFLDTQEPTLTINNPDQVMRSLGREKIIEAFSPRTLSLNMITSPANLSSVLAVGVEPRTEQAVSKVDEAVREGDFLKGENPRDIVIGNELAEVLEVSLGERVVLTVSQAESGDLAQDMFRVSGIYHFGVKEMDNGMVFIHIKKAQEMLNINGQVHEIAIKFKDLKYAEDDGLSFWKKYSRDGNEALSWGELLPDLKGFFEMTGVFRSVMSLLLMFVVIFGIINTLFMSLYERMFELGVLRAVGTRPWGVMKLMLCESGALAVLSIAIGLFMGLVITGLFAIIGIDYRGIEFAGSVIQEVVYPVMKPFQFIVYPVGLFVFMLLVGLYPAGVAARMSIADAIRKSL
ncbi:MAG: ABC transporter permease [Spirochaetales bacterium]|nr:ABC transporter permease [Spirochaetales bacterium]